MNQDQLVEAIINEVKRVLALRGVSISVSPTSPAPEKKSLTPTAEKRAPLVPSAARTTDQPIGSRDLTGKQIITQKDLELFQGKSITVTRKAVITPLAVDYARGKGITITRVAETQVPGGRSETSQSSITVVLTVAPDFPGDRTFVKNFLISKGLQVHEPTDKSYETAVSTLAREVASGTAEFGICVERTGMEAPIYANRNKNIRAVHCRQTLDARAARVDIGANVIVIDSVSNPEEVIGGFIGL